MAKLQFRRPMFGSRLPMVAFTSRPFELQLFPNPYIRLGAYDVAVDANGFLVSTPRLTFGYIRKAGWHRSHHGGR